MLQFRREATMSWPRTLPIFPTRFPSHHVAGCMLLLVATIAVSARAQERIISCRDPRTQLPVEIRAVRVRAGAIDSTWTPDSTRLCIGSTEGVLPSAVTDGTGG